MPSIERVVFLKELTWQATRRWWDWDVPDPWRPMDKATYRTVKRRLRRRALREGSLEFDEIRALGLDGADSGKSWVEAVGGSHE